MTNAKSRLVRVIALALAVLMIVPMALVGCKKTDDTPVVDQAAIDAAIKEALDAAQKAQDAADKAAQDAKDAQDKLAASEKEAADLQAQIDAMKNTTTTAAPATTTKAPVAEDTTVVDAYIASVVLDAESPFNKLIAKYVDAKGDITAMALAYLGANTDPISADAKAIKDTIDTAKIAIQRAQTVDYVNALVAKLAVDLDAIPTISERVKAAYDAIDFASDEDIVDVAYANALLAEANNILGIEIAEEEVVEFFEAEKKALKAYGDDKLDLNKLITEEFYRYSGKGSTTAADVEVLYEDVFGYDAEALVNAIIALFGEENDKFDVKKIVYGTAANEDAIEAIEDAYDEFYKLYKKDYAALQDAFEIAVVGEDYLLKAEGNFLREKLAAAKVRVAELEAAAEEFKATKVLSSNNNGIKAFAENYYNNYGSTFLFTDKQNAKIVAIADALATWMTTYGFATDDGNLDAIIGMFVDAKGTETVEDDVKVSAYATFAELKAVMNFVNEWKAKLADIDASDIEDAVKEITNTAAGADTRIDYAEQGAAVKALVVWYYGTYKLDKAEKNNNKYLSNNDGANAAKLVYRVGDAEKEIALDEANIKDMLKDVLDFNFANIGALKTAIEVFEGAYFSGKAADTAKDGYVTSELAILAEIKAIVKDASKIDLDALTSEILEKDVDAIIKRIKDVCDELDLTEEEEEGDTEFGYETDSKNYGVVPFDTWAALKDASDALLASMRAEASDIIKAYIGWKGTYDEDEEAVKYNGKYYDVDVVEISAYSYALVSKLATAYKNIAAYDLTQSIEIEDIEGEKQPFSTDNVVSFYRQINDEFYYAIMDKIHAVACTALRNSTVVGTIVASQNEWMDYNYKAYDSVNTNASTNNADNKALYEIEKAYGEFGLKFVYPTASWNVGKGAGDINVYKTNTTKTADLGTGDNNKTYVKAILAVDPLKYATKNADNTSVIAFDVAAYKAAVDASIASYRGSWYAKYLERSENATFINRIYKNVIDNAIEFALWTIEGKFEMDNEEYKFVVNADKTVTIFDTTNDKFNTTDNIFKGTFVYFDETANEDVKVENAVITLSASTDNNKVTIMATAGDKTVELAYTDADTTVDAPKFEYTLADGIAQIVANSKAIGTIKKADAPSSSYVVYQEAWLTALQTAFETNQFYVYRDSYVVDKDDNSGKLAYEYAETAKKAADEAGDLLIDKLFAEFKGEWKSAKHTSTTAADIQKAYVAYTKQINKIVAEHDQLSADILAKKADADAYVETAKANAAEAGHADIEAAYDALVEAFDTIYATEYATVIASFASQGDAYSYTTPAAIATAYATFTDAVDLAVSTNPVVPETPETPETPVAE